MLAVVLPRSALFAPAPVDRQSHVISAFINATVDPGTGGIVKTDWLVSNRQLRDVRVERLAHIHPKVLAAFAAARGETEEAFRTLLIDPQADDPFEQAGLTFNITKPFSKGAVEGWDWALLPESQGPTSGDRLCGVWLLFWTGSDWFYAPAGTPELQAQVVAALPEFAGLFEGELPVCPTDQDTQR